MNNKKNRSGVKRLVACALILAMLLTLMPTSAFAARQNSLFGWLFSGLSSYSQPKAEEPAPEPAAEEPAAEEPAAEEPAAEEPAPEEPAAEEPEEPAAEEPAAEEPVEAASPVLAEELEIEEDLLVSIEAEEGAFPEGTQVSAEKADISEVQKAVDEAEDLSGEVLVAVDITFTCGGEELQPAEGKTVKVNISAPELDGKAEEATVVHIDSETKEAEEVDTLDAPADDEVAFEAEKFSVYAVIGNGETGEEARLKVVFHDKSGNPIENGTMYVKKADTLAANADKYEKILYDPGCGTLDSETREMFYGWLPTTGTTYPAYDTTTTTYNITQLRAYVATLFAAESENAVKEGDVLNVYPAIFKAYSVTYLGDGGVSLGSDVVKLLPSATSVAYEVNKGYTPPDNQHNFEGWEVKEGASNIDEHTPGKLYPNETDIVISGDVVFSAYAPYGRWVIYHSNDGTYVAPDFVIDGQNTVEPTKEMKKIGATFEYWCTDEGLNNRYYFNAPILDDLHLYAKWKDNTEGDFVVLIWKQKTSGTGYDFAESKSYKDYTVGSTIDVVTDTGSGDGRYAILYDQPSDTNEEKKYPGFHLDHYEDDKTVSAKNDTVVNVYYNRNEVTLDFQVYEQYYTYTLSTSNSSGTYYLPNGNGGYDEVYLYYNNGTFYRNRSGLGIPFLSPFQYSNPYYGDRYTRSSNTGFHTVQTMTGLYGSTLESNGYTWPTDRWWYEEYTTWGGNYYGSGTRMTVLDAFILPDDGSFQTFYGFTSSGNNNVYFYKQNADGNGYTEANHVTSSNGDFIITDKYNGFKAVSYNINNGSTWTNLGDKNAAGEYARVSNWSTLRIRYDRLLYNILYSEGKYFDRDGVPVSNPPVGTYTGDVEENVPYGSSLADYGPNGSKYKQPTQADYVFECWCVDDACTVPFDFDNNTMPEGLTLYAKWRQANYRVFLHPQAVIEPEGGGTPVNDTTLNWGGTPAMCFLVAAGEKVDVPFGTRETGYELAGWFFDPDGERVFNEDYFILNDESVPPAPAYDKTVDMTDTMDIFGEGATWNKDLYATYEDWQNGVQTNRFYVTRKLDLYAVWRATLGDAKGIGVEYDLRGGTGSVSDPLLYVDKAFAVAQGAPATAPKGTDSETGEQYDQRFLYWVLQRWDASAGENGEGAFVDIDGSAVYPGDHYQVKETNARKVVSTVTVTDPDTGDTTTTTKTTYTIRLRAEYGRAESADRTHIWWYGNGGKTSDDETVVKKNKPQGSETEVETFGINVAVEIKPADTFSYPGYRFIGWGKGYQPEKEEGATEEPAYVMPTEPWLVWDGEKFTVTKDGSTYAVTHVAADEIKPYEDLYAMWEKRDTFKVVYMSDVNAGTVASDKIYEFYLEDFRDAAGEENNGKPYLNVVNGSSTITDINGNASLRDVYGNKLYGGYRSATFNTQGKLVLGDYGTTVRGDQIIPAKDAVYFVRDVDTAYLRPFVRYFYNEETKTVGTVYFISCLDDTMYSDAGFLLKELKDDETTAYAKIGRDGLARSLQFKNQGEGTKPIVNPDPVPLSPSVLLGDAATSTSLMEYKETFKAFSPTYTPGVRVQASYSVIAYWVTMDGIPVVGKSGYDITIHPDDDTPAVYTENDTDFAAALAPFAAT